VPPPTVLLFDTNAIIEAVRTGCWAAVTGQYSVETVEAVVSESKAGDPGAPGYVPVGEADLLRLGAVYSVSETQRGALADSYGDADGLDRGERDLFAHGLTHKEEVWLVCSPDKASVRAAMKLGWRERLCSLENLAQTVGIKPNPPLGRQFCEPWLSSFCTQILLESGL